MIKTIRNLLIISSSLFVIALALVFFFYSSKEEVEDKTFLSNTSDIVFSHVDESVMLGDIVPTIDKFGILNEPLGFTIKNMSSRQITYELKLFDDNSTIKNSSIRYQLTKNGMIIGVFSLNENGVIDVACIDANEEINYSVKMWLDFQSDAKMGNVNLKISVNEKEENTMKLVNSPILADGMIPVYYDDKKMAFVKTSTNNLYNYEWYDYSAMKWANAITVDEKKRDYYTKLALGETIDMNDINSMWVWIPRFNYTVNEDNIDVQMVDINQEAYEAFNFDGEEQRGFWVSKYEAGLAEDDSCVKSHLSIDCNHLNHNIYFKPNMPLMERMTMANLFYSFRKMELKDNIYGFKGNGTIVNLDGSITNDDNNIDIHMIRNSEWQAVAILSKSIYGTNGKKIYPNDSGISGKVFYEKEEYNYDIKDIGVKGSTTGTIYGIYDMNGGKREFVMFSNKDNDLFYQTSNSAFSTKVMVKYYDTRISAKDQTLLTRMNLDEFLINNEPLTRGGYKDLYSDIFNMYGHSNYIDKISLETNSRPVINILGGTNGKEEKES